MVELSNMSIFAVILVSACVATSIIHALEVEDFECDVKDELTIDAECNKCYCTDDEELACTVGICPDDYVNNYEFCIPGTSWPKDCNKCWCVETVGAVCTKKECGDQ